MFRLTLFTFCVAMMTLTQNAIASDEGLDLITHFENTHTGNAKKRFHTWKNLIIDNQSKSTAEKLKATNDLFNLFAYQSDTEFEGVEDYWKTPEEFVNDGGGDCEDYAITKYFTLITLGIPESSLRITYVKSLKFGAHMVLAYYETPEAEPLVLDNLEPAIKPASQRPDLIPIYSFNGGGLWLAKQRGGDKPLSSSSSLGQWTALISRMKH